MLGIYNQFTFEKSKSEINTSIVYKTPLVNCIFTGAGAAVVKRFSDDTVVNTGSAISWDIEGVTINAVRIDWSVPTTGEYYIVVDNYLYTDLIAYDSCIEQLFSHHDCDNQFYAWEADSDDLIILMTNSSFLPSKPIQQTIEIISQYGASKKVVSSGVLESIQFLGPSGYTTLLNGIKNNSYNAINTGAGLRQIKNIEVQDSPQGDTGYSIFVLEFEFADVLSEGSSCCEIINIDEILSPDTGGGGAGGCLTFSATIINTDGTLSVDLIDPPMTGSPSYKWYKNGAYLASTATVEVLEPGEYRVDVVQDGCRTKATYFKDDPCSIYQLALTKTGNEINGVTSNVPDGETEVYSVVLNGVEVATSLPYLVEEDGTYYVYVTAGRCNVVKGIAMVVEETDCDYTISITKSGNTLTAVTDAGSPTYQWEKEDINGRNVVGAASTQQLTGEAIYWLTIENGACQKETYFPYFTTEEKEIYCVLARSNGYEFTVYGIDIMEVDPTDLEVTVDGITQVFVAGTPTLSTQWGRASDKIIFDSSIPLEDSLIIITKK